MKILSDYTWNNHRYVKVQRDDGTTIEVKGDPDMSDDEALEKCPAPDIAPTGPVVSDSEILAEVSRRGLAVEIAKSLSENDLLAEVAQRDLKLRVRGEAI